MKKIFGILIVVAVIAGIIVLLLNNKAKMEQKSKTEIVTTVPVMTYQVAKESFERSLSLIGTLAPFREVSIGAEASGKVLGVFFELGQNISAGRTLAKVDDEIKVATVQNAEANYAKAKKDLERYEELFKLQSVQEIQLDNARLAFRSAESQLVIAQRQLIDTRIVSPMSGIVTVKNIERGSYVSTGNVIATIANISSLKAKVNVPENDAFKLRVGNTVDVTTEIYPDIVFKGRITAIIAKADDAHSFPVEVTIANSGFHPLKAGIFVKISFPSIQKGEAVLIPREALVGSILDAKVYVVVNGFAFLRKITIGSDLGDKLEVSDGLTDGEVIVVNGQLNLRDSTQVTNSK